MAENQQNINFGQEIAAWQVPEYDKHERPRSWYISISVIVISLLLYSYFTANFLFAVIIIIGSMIIIWNDGREPDLVRIALTSEGVEVGRKFYDYDELKNFSIVYKPNIDVKKLYFEFKSPLKQRLSIQLDGMNPLPIRENLLKYLPEDLERTNESLSEGLAKLFKL